MISRKPLAQHFVETAPERGAKGYLSTPTKAPGHVGLAEIMVVEDSGLTYPVEIQTRVSAWVRVGRRWEVQLDWVQ